MNIYATEINEKDSVNSKERKQREVYRRVWREENKKQMIQLNYNVKTKRNNFGQLI